MAVVVPGIPADFGDRIVARRARIVVNYPDFTGSHLRLLDTGCGNGATVYALARHFSTCQGVDICPEHVESFLREAGRRRVHNCTTIVDDLFQSSLAEDAFDRLISSEVIGHLRDEHKGVQTVFRLLRTNGMFAISVPNKWWVFETHGAYLPVLPWNRVPLFSWLPEALHSRFAKARIYTKRLPRTGFRVRYVRCTTTPMDRLTVPSLQKMATGTVFGGDTTPIPFLSTSIMVIGDKP